LRSLALHKLTLLILAFFAVYAALLFVGLRFGVLITLERGIAVTAVPVLALVSDPSYERRVGVEQQGGEVRQSLRYTVGTESVAATSNHTFHAQNLLLLLALGLATPGLALRPRLIGLGAGLALTFGVDVLIFSADLIYAAGRVLHLADPGVSPFVQGMGQVLRFLHPTGGLFMLPMFLWGLLLLGPYRHDVMHALERSPAPGESPSS
jgi:hypothetical protein